MNRRQFILALSAGAALLGAAPARAECGGPSAVEFVEELYEKQARLQAQNTPLGQDEFLAMFSKVMRALMQAPRHPARSVSLGPLLNAFFGWGVLPREGLLITTCEKSKTRRTRWRQIPARDSNPAVPSDTAPRRRRTRSA